VTHYSEHPGTVRVDYFRPSGKWYMTEAVDMDGYWGELIPHSAVEKALTDHWEDTRGPDRKDAWRQFTIVVLDPYHHNGYPVMLVAE
jgi:hypothetical protein